MKAIFKTLNSTILYGCIEDVPYKKNGMADADISLPSFEDFKLSDYSVEMDVALYKSYELYYLQFYNDLDDVEELLQSSVYDIIS